MNHIVTCQHCKKTFSVWDTTLFFCSQCGSAIGPKLDVDTSRQRPRQIRFFLLLIASGYVLRLLLGSLALLVVPLVCVLAISGSLKNLLRRRLAFLIAAFNPRNPSRRRGLFALGQLLGRNVQFLKSRVWNMFVAWRCVRVESGTLVEKDLEAKNSDQTGRNP